MIHAPKEHFGAEALLLSPGEPEVPSSALEELFAKYGIIPRPYIFETPADKFRKEQEWARPRVLSPETRLFLTDQSKFRFAPESFAQPPGSHLCAGCCDRRANVDIASPGVGIFNHGFIEYLDSLVARGHSVDIETHEDCLAGQAYADQIKLYHPEDMTNLYGKVLANRVGGRHRHVKLQMTPEDAFTIYLDPTGALQNPTLSGLPRGFKITVSRENIDETVHKKIEFLLGMATSMPELKLVVDIVRNYKPDPALPKPCIVVVDDRSRLAKRTIRCAHQTLVDMHADSSVNLVSMAAPWLHNNTRFERVEKDATDDPKYYLA
jgi:hypothetical protein